MFELILHHLDAIDGEPRILDLRVAERLGFARPRAVRQLIERSKTELESYGFIATRCGAYRTRKFTEYWLNEPQALLVCLLSRTEKAAEVRRSLIAVFTAWRRGKLGSSRRSADLTRAQRKAINSRAWALTREEAQAVFQQHQVRLTQAARELLASGRPIEQLLSERTFPNKAPESISNGKIP